MGYESKIFVVNKSSVKGPNESKYWAEDIASFDLSCCPDIRNVFKEETDCYIYADDGNTKILEDMYGEALKEANISDLVKRLEDIINKGETYRRLKPCLSLLKGFDMSQWENLVVLHYGH